MIIKKIKYVVFLLIGTATILIITSNINIVQRDTQVRFLPTWHYNIIAHQDEEMFISIPFYSKKNNLDIEQYELRTNLDDILNVVKHEVSIGQKSEHYNQYTLNLLVSFKNPMILKNNELMIHFKINNQVYEKNIVIFNGEIISSNKLKNDIEIKSFIPFIVTEVPSQYFKYEVVLKNKTNHNFEISDIMVPEKFVISKNSIQFPRMLESNSTLSIELMVKTDLDYLYSFKPTLIIDDLKYTLSNQIMALDPSPQYLQELLD
ncbi:hypothetical protein E0485_07845 [Paenibacillus albiflavus]|uniref:Uncharacterized protein n=1 Tax=Paenibacillus albiflavus TaxID=2545760 RepID=A0A4R4EFQ9_9BACL|nr:hypothetical protein [Paenibacillus albiflavus]TCZ78407.1 hypothetical protein E0485_07845 [Paenibacillus albiflavus]